MKAIVAVDEKWGIGKNNDLLFSLPADMKFFRETTMGKVVVMGSNTLKSFPGGNPLKNRVNIVLSSKMQREDCIIAKDLEELKAILKTYPTQDLMVIGGAMFYKTMLPYCEEVLVTKVNADGDADTFFGNLDALENFTCISESEPIETNGITIKFTTYKNSSVIEL